MEKELGNFLKYLPINLSLNPSLMCYEVSFVKLKLFPESYLSHVSIYGDLCAFSFGGLFLVVSYASTFLSSHAFLEDSLLHSGSIFDPSCYGFGMLDNTSSVDPKFVHLKLECALIDVLHDKSIGHVLTLIECALIC
ncbi:hypothetical protein M9H77_29663 [Catharanthus roseus]|uniref:Uncharacterized protein n=1 Tax=Catharanthus roseus TaxID=4058 RepID=A0ACB9ZW00_CATRO|nr:hypothetical protein M9H77_29663 [Catharanthus roseus]